MMIRLKKFINLPFEDKKMVMNAFWTLIVVRCWLSIMPFQKVWERYNTSGGDDFNNTQSNPDIVKHIAGTVDRVANHIPGTQCLPRALTTKKMLLDYGYQSQLRIGVIKNANGEFSAHAWVERQNEIIIGDLDQLRTYASF